jgi:hypothetical protein
MESVRKVIASIAKIFDTKIKIVLFVRVLLKEREEKVLLKKPYEKEIK